MSDKWCQNSSMFNSTFNFRRLFYRFAIIVRNSSVTSFNEYIGTIFIAVAMAVLVRLFVLTAYRVPTGSMQPTLLPGDFIFALRPAFLMGREPRLGDVIVFTYPNRKRVLYVKRVLGVSGDKVEIVDGRLRLNGQELEREPLVEGNGIASLNPNAQMFEMATERDLGPTTSEARKWTLLIKKDPTSANFGPLMIPPGEVFVLGDNRDASDDSRDWGTVPFDHILGKVFMVWFSANVGQFEKDKSATDLNEVRWSRLFKSIN